MGTQTIFDYVVIGAGISGASVAYELSLKKQSVLIIEMEEFPGFHATGRSAAFFAETYGNHTVRCLTKASRDFFENAPKNFCENELFKARGALFIARDDQLEKLNQFYMEVSKLSDKVVQEDAAFALRKVGKLIPETIAGCVWDPDSQEIDVAALHQGYLKLAKQNGAELKLNAAVTELINSENHWQIKTKDKIFSAKVIVNAAGAWADKVAQMAAVKPVGLVPKKRTVAVVPIEKSIDVNDWPLVVDIDEEFYFKPEGGNLLLSPADETPVEPMDAYTEMMDVAVAVERVTAVLDIEIKQVSHEWAGLRTFVEDKSPVIGFDSENSSFFWLAGQGGYGIQMAPACAKLAASLMLGEKPSESLLAFGFEISTVLPQRIK